MREVDLHLRSGQAGADALDRQMARFRGELNSSIRAGEQGVIFIHGVGSGKLREAIHAVLASDYTSCGWHDASFSRYGYNGATVVTIKR
jgi:dsDNA-specific endonuclease/ATPase MutS2